jgi:hypothetical protein
MKANFFLSIFSLVLVLSFQSCKHDPVTQPGPEVSFSRDVQPIIIGNCTSSGCHEALSIGEAEPLTNYGEIMDNGKIKAGYPEDSELFEEIDRGSMPQGGPRLSQTNIELIRYWIIQGAKNN